MLHDIWMAETQAAAEKAFDLFGTTLYREVPGLVLVCLSTVR